MKRLSPNEFLDYIAGNDPRYIYNPLCNVAFKDTGVGRSGKLYCKGQGGREFQISLLDEDFERALMFRTVMTAAEYEGFK